jgi:phosphate acetyltransferase
MFNVKTLINRAKKLDKTIVFPEAEISDRVIKAVEYILRHKIAKVILLGDEKIIVSKSKKLKGAVIINPKTSELVDEFVNKLVELRGHKGVDNNKARELLKDNNYFASMLVYLGFADGYLGGAENTTANTLRPALQIIKTKDDVDIVSSCFMMVGKHKYGQDGVVFVADCALNVAPTAKDLKDITLSTVKTARDLCKIDPRVAMLSYSSFGSGGNDDVSILKMREALQLIKIEDKSLNVDGEMQLDCAIVPEVGQRKGKDSPVAGKANILIFPDLNAGNIGYKIMERFGKMDAVGVIMQGFKKPVNDLSRGCKVKDIILMTAITCIQSAE